MANDKDIMVLPSDEERELLYKRFDAYPVKYLMPDGSVWSGLPVSTGLRFVVAIGNASFTVVYE